jgi:hypothetical protein
LLLLRGGKRNVVLLWKRDLELAMPDSPPDPAGFHGHDGRHGPARVQGLDRGMGLRGKNDGRFKDGKSICTQMERHAGLHDAILHGDDEPQDAGGKA